MPSSFLLKNISNVAEDCCKPVKIQSRNIINIKEDIYYVKSNNGNEER